MIKKIRFFLCKKRIKIKKKNFSKKKKSPSFFYPIRVRVKNILSVLQQKNGWNSDWSKKGIFATTKKKNGGFFLIFINFHESCFFVSFSKNYYN